MCDMLVVCAGVCWCLSCAVTKRCACDCVTTQHPAPGCVWQPTSNSHLSTAALVHVVAVLSTYQGFRGRGGTTTQRLDGAIYAASNAALMLAQLGEEEGALKEVRGGDYAGSWLLLVTLARLVDSQTGC